MRSAFGAIVLLLLFAACEAATEAGVAVQVEAVGRTSATGTAGAVLSTPLVVRVRSGTGRPVSATLVAWEIVDGGGSLSSATSITDADGRASIQWTLGTVAGTGQHVRAKIATDSVTFEATAVAGAAATVTITGTTSGVVGSPDVQLSAIATDAFGNLVSTAALWTSSNTAAATVDATGLVHAVSAGQTTIQASVALASGQVTFISVDGVALGTPTALASSMTPSGSPTDVRYTNHLTWTDNSANETRFEVEVKDPNNVWVTQTTTSANVVTYDHLVAANLTKVYRVRACNAMACSGYSNELTVTGPPNTPSPLTGTTIIGSVLGKYVNRLVWADNSDNETRFEVEILDASSVWVPLATTAANVATYDHLVNPGTTSRYRVRTCNASGCSEYSFFRSCTNVGGCTYRLDLILTAPALAAPTALSNTTTQSGSPPDHKYVNHLTWTDHSDNETFFEVGLMDQFSGWVVQATVPANVTAYDHLVSPTTTKVYRIRACQPPASPSSGQPVCSLSSNELTVTSPP
jgi:hypothetical protein